MQDHARGITKVNVIKPKITKYIIVEDQIMKDIAISKETRIPEKEHSLAYLQNVYYYLQPFFTTSNITVRRLATKNAHHQGLPHQNRVTSLTVKLPNLKNE